MLETQHKPIDENLEGIIDFPFEPIVEEQQRKYLMSPRESFGRNRRYREYTGRKGTPHRYYPPSNPRGNR